MSSESSESSSSSSDDEYQPEVNEEFEKSFFKTLSSLKNNDPSIYDKDKKFFDDASTIVQVKNKIKGNQEPKEKPLFLKDYERKCLTENEGYDENKDEEPFEVKGVPYVVEQRQLKNSFKSFLNDSDDEESESLLKPLVKDEQDKEKEEAEYIQWLKGQKQELQDKATESNLKNLRDYWNSDGLGEDEAFLRDYILNKQFLDNDESEDDDDGDDDHLSEDSETFEAQEKFEQEYNFRYETGDNLIRRFPRNVEDSLRRKENKRSKKRAEIKERKGLEKQKKREEINRQKKIKIKEISERLNKLKELTGNEKLAFNDDDILNDFDPSEHDKKMSEMYNDEFYNEQDGDKPLFDNADIGDIDEEDYYEMNHDQEEEEAKSRKDKKKTRTKKKKERKKKAFSDISCIEKPIYDPKLHESYQKYMDEYYQLDCEDFIEDIPCRYKYRQVEPNDYGLSVEEILTADDKELNQWSSMKKIHKIRPSHVEKNEAKIYRLKGQNESLKIKILPSLYQVEDNDNNSKGISPEEKQNNVNSQKKKKKSKKKNENVEQADINIENDTELPVNSDTPEDLPQVNIDSDTGPQNNNKTGKSKKKKRKFENGNEPDVSPSNKLLKKSESFEEPTLDSNEAEIPHHNSTKPKKQFNKLKKHQNNFGYKAKRNHNFHDSRLSAYGLNPKKFKIKS